MTPTKELHPFHARTGLVPLDNTERCMVCVRCGANFRLSTGGKALPNRTPGRGRPSAIGKCKDCMDSCKIGMTSG